MTNQKQDGELSSIIVINGLFMLALLGVDIWYSDWAIMFHPLFGGLLAIALHVVVLYLWIVVLFRWQDPNYDGYRKVLLGAIIITLITVAGWHVAVKDRNDVQIEANKNKALNQ